MSLRSTSRKSAAPRALVAAAALAGAVLSGDAARAVDVADVIPSLYGGDGITLGNPGHDAHFLSSTFQQLALINQGLSEIPGNLPIGSSAASFTYAFNPASGVPERQADEGLGPLYVERARTLGGDLFSGDIRFSLAAQYTHLDFKQFEGDRLDRIRLIARHDEIAGDNDFENDVILIDMDIAAREEIFSLYGTLAITPWLDVAVVVPLVYIDLNAKAKATIVDRGGNGIHFFDPDPGTLINGRPTDGDLSANKASAFGIADTFVRAKWCFLEAFAGDEPALLSDKMEFALTGQVKFPTGDEDQLLGTGKTDFRIGMVASKTYNNFFEPHFFFGYEWNGVTYRRDAFIWSAGAAIRVIDQLTMWCDVVGRKKRVGEGIGDNIVDLVIGGKVNPISSLIISPSVLIPLNEEGVRPDYAPSITVEYIF